MATITDVTGDWRLRRGEGDAVDVWTVSGQLSAALVKAAALAYEAAESVDVIDVFGGPTFTVSVK